MRQPGGNHLDRRRTLLPRDYFAPPGSFGQQVDARLTVPPGGDPVSAVVAKLQHDLVVRWRAQNCRPSGAALGRRFGFSRQTWSRAVLGERWMGETLFAVLVLALREPHRPNGQARHVPDAASARWPAPSSERGTR